VSSPAPFQVINPAPQIATLTPNTVFYAAADTTVTINGSAFVPTSVAKLGTSSLTTAFVSSTQLTAVVPASALKSITTLSVTVFTPAPGGGTSSAAQLFITCDSTNVDVPLGAVSNITTRNVFYSGPDVNHVAAAACPQTALSGFVEPIAQWVVQNNSTSPVVLSSWAVCSMTSTTQSDAFLAVYRGGTKPVDDASRMMCAAGTVGSEGALGSSGNYSSPDANGSNWCPGLTKANGAGLTLAACEKAVVTMQPFSVASGTSYPAPTQIRFEPESP
ncbi:MAG: IPT/TIG domain-containing protein, partial [Polyangiaceae bacterium]